MSGGRPKLPPELKKEVTGYRISQWVTDALKEQYPDENQGALFEHAVIKTYKLKRPKF